MENSPAKRLQSEGLTSSDKQNRTSQHVLLKTIQALKNEHQDRLAGLAWEQAAKLQQDRLQREQELDSLREVQRNELRRVRNEAEQALKELTRTHKTQLQRLKRGGEQQVFHLQARIQQLEKELAAQREELERTVRAKPASPSSEIVGQIGRLNQQAAARDGQTARLQNILTASSLQLTMLRKERQGLAQTVAALKNALLERDVDCERKLAAANHELATLLKRFKERENQLLLQSFELASECQNLQNQNFKLSEDTARLRLEVASLQADRDMTLRRQSQLQMTLEMAETDLACSRPGMQSGLRQQLAELEQEKLALQEEHDILRSNYDGLSRAYRLLHHNQQKQSPDFKLPNSQSPAQTALRELRAQIKKHI